MIAVWLCRKVLPPPSRYELWHDDGDRLIRLASFGDFGNILQERLKEQSIGGFKNHQAYASAPQLPLLPHRFGLGGVDRHVHGGDIVRQRTRIA